MVDTEYQAQERELQRRLPHVSLEVIKYFLVQHQGNLDECYQQLRTHTPTAVSPDMEPFFSKFGGTATLPHPRQYHPRPDNRAYQRQTTWDSRFHTLPSRSSHSSRSAHQLYGDTGGDLHTHGGQRYDVAQGAMYGMAQPQHNWTTSYTREAPNPQGVVAVTRLAAQRQQLEAIQKYQGDIVQNLSRIRQEMIEKQQRLSVLRMEVSALVTQQQIAELKEEIQTLEFDLREARRELQVHKVQSQMKQEQDLYTDEGVRWYCEECSFLNHPLMTLCEQCNIPKNRPR